MDKKTKARLDKLNREQKEINSQPNNPLVSDLVEYLVANGPTKVKTLQEHFNTLTPKAIRRPFQKLNLKRGGESVIEINGHFVGIDTRGQQSIYFIKK